MSLEAVKREKLRLEQNPEERTVRSIKCHIEFLLTGIKMVESEIREILETKTSDIKEVLQSEKGIGEQTAAILIGSLPALGRLENRQITKLVGLAPMAHEILRSKIHFSL